MDQWIKLVAPCLHCGKFERFRYRNEKYTRWVCFVCGDQMTDIKDACCYISTTTFQIAKSALKLKGIE